MRRLVIAVATAALLASSGLFGAPAAAAEPGPGRPAQITEVEVKANDLGGNQALVTSTLTVTPHWILCGGPGGRCNPNGPTIYELQIGIANFCGAADCAWARAPMVFAGPINSAWGIHGFDRIVTPAVDQFVGRGLPTGTLIGVTARVRNAEGWSNRSGAQIPIVATLPNDRVPTNIAPPTLWSYAREVQQSLVVGANAMPVGSVWRGSVSPPSRIRSQVLPCPDAACQVAEADWARYAGEGWQCEVPRPDRNDPLTDRGCYLYGANYSDAVVGYRARSQAQNQAGWSAWAYSPVVLVHPDAAPQPSNQPICVLCRPIGIPIDLGVFVPALPAVDAGAVARPSPTRAPAFTMAAGVAEIPVQTAVPAGSALGAVGTAWALPVGWSAPDTVANSAFTLWGCATTDAGSCLSVGSWPADASLVGIPRLTSMGTVAPATSYVRVAQTTDLVNPAGVPTSFTTLSDWIVLTPGSGPAIDPNANANPNGNANGGQPDGSVPAVDAAIAQVLPEVTAAGVNQTVSPVGGTAGSGTVAGRTMVVRFPAHVRHTVKYRATARITPKAKGTVRFVVTRRTPSNRVVVGKVRVAKVRKGKAVTSWRFESAKPASTYVIVATFTPKRVGVLGITVTLTTILK